MMAENIYELLIGKWKNDCNDLESIRMYGNTMLEFIDNNRLVYHIYQNDKEQIINLTYKIRGNILITNQPSLPTREKTQFKIINNKELILIYDNIKVKYIKDIKII